jgi:hypothetical protein
LFGFSPAVRRLEDVAAEAGEEGIHVVRVAARALWTTARPNPSVALLLEGEGLLLEIVPALRNLREFRVDEEADVLERDRHAVQLPVR